MKNKILTLTFVSLIFGSIMVKAQTPEVVFDTIQYNNGMDSLSFRYARFRAIIVSAGSWTLNGKGFAISTNPDCAPPYVVRLAGTPNQYTPVPYNFTGQTSTDGLVPNTTYYAKAFVKNTSGGTDTAWSSAITFTTPSAIPPTMSMSAATNIGLMEATLNGIIEQVNDPVKIPWIKKGFVYSLNPNPVHGAGTTEVSIAGANPNNNNSNTPFPMTTNLTGLLSGVTYYARLFIIVKFGAGNNDTIYSAQMPFTTRHACGTAPSSVDATADVGQTTALIKWEAKLGQTQWQVECGIVGHTPGTGEFQQIVTSDTFIVATGLTPNVTYTAYVRAVCGDTTFSEWSALNPSSYFQTLPYICAPIAEIAATQVLNTSAIIQWTPGISAQWRWEVAFATYYDSYPQTGIIIHNNPEYAPFGLSPATIYKVKVRAICDHHDDVIDTISEWSEEVVFTTKNAPYIGLYDVSQDRAFVKIYPNPSSNEIYFDNRGINITKIEIIDVSGKIIAGIDKNFSSYKFDKGRTGTFFIKIYTDNGIQNEKIIVE